MNVIAGKSPAPSSIALSIASIIYGISSLVLETCSFEVSHTRRNGNQLHLLAKYAQYFEHYINWIEESPYFLEHVLSNYVMSFRFS